MERFPELPSGAAMERSPTLCIGVLTGGVGAAISARRRGPGVALKRQASGGDPVVAAGEWDVCLLCSTTGERRPSEDVVHYVRAKRWPLRGAMLGRGRVLRDRDA